MRKLIVGVVLAAAVVGTGIWTVQDRAAKLEAALSSGASVVAQSAIHSVDVNVSGRDITISGLANDEDEKARLLEALGGLDGHGEIVDQLEILPVADPFTFAARRSAGKTLLQGNVTSEQMRAALAQSGTDGASELTLASGAPDRWEAVAGSGVSALSQIDEGSVSITDTAVRLTGLVDTPDDRNALISSLALPEGFTLQTDIETRDDGAPVDFTLAFDVASGFEANGKLPAGLTLDSISAALGGVDVAGDAAPGLPGGPKLALMALEALKSEISNLEVASVQQSQEVVTMTASVKPGLDPSETQSRLQNSLGTSVDVTVSALSPLPAEGTRRTNVITGEQEFFSAGQWGPDMPFQPSLEACRSQTNALLERMQIPFVSGSVTFEPDAARSIAALANVMRRCIIEAALTAELGGHTDARGDGNFELSAARAQAVRNALARQGVPVASVAAVGYGPSKPIASNDTEEGRAANRRITVVWGR